MIDGRVELGRKVGQKDLHSMNSLDPGRSVIQFDMHVISY